MVGFSTLSRTTRVLAPAALLAALLVLYLGVAGRETGGVLPGFTGFGFGGGGTDALADGLDREDGGGSAIAEVCAAKNWTAGAGILFGCEAAAGGVAQVRSAHLTCIRLAIEAGAELILPRIVRRPERSPTKERPNANGPIRGQAMSFFFDEEHTVATLDRWCPQLRVYRSIDELWDQPTLQAPLRFGLGDVTAGQQQQSQSGQILSDPAGFGPSFWAWLDEKSPPDRRRLPLLAELSETRGVWPRGVDSAEFARQFGALLRVRPDARRLAASALRTLGRRYGVGGGTGAGAGGGWAGVDLRTAHEAAADGWPGYIEQAAHYLGALAGWELPVAYLGGEVTRPDAAAFRKSAAELNVTVVQAADLLDLDTERRGPIWPLFSWDQKQLVDYELMRRAGRFAGTAMAEFAWDVAVRRHFAWDEGDELPAARAAGGGEVRFRDRHSVVYGRPGEGPDEIYRATIWP